MRELFCLLLIPLLIVSQSLGLLAHGHASGHGSGPVDHASRPHIHSHERPGHHHHHGYEPHPIHSHEGTVPIELSAVDSHDSDAVYISTSVSYLLQRQTDIEGRAGLQHSVAFLHPFAAIDVAWMLPFRRPDDFGQTRCAHRLVAFESLSLRI